MNATLVTSLSLGHYNFLRTSNSTLWWTVYTFTLLAGYIGLTICEKKPKTKSLYVLVLFKRILDLFRVSFYIKKFPLYPGSDRWGTSQNDIVKMGRWQGHLCIFMPKTPLYVFQYLCQFYNCLL